MHLWVLSLYMYIVHNMLVQCRATLWVSLSANVTFIEMYVKSMYLKHGRSRSFAMMQDIMLPVFVYESIECQSTPPAGVEVLHAHSGIAAVHISHQT